MLFHYKHYRRREFGIGRDLDPLGAFRRPGVIDGLDDNPARYNAKINAVIEAALAPARELEP
jgi:hypothetical protein